MPTPAGIPFSKMPCIVFFPLVMASPYSSKACGLQPYPTQNSLVKEPNLNHSGFLASSFMKSDKFSIKHFENLEPTVYYTVKIVRKTGTPSSAILKIFRQLRPRDSLIS
jgi:hypothetical protein